MLKPGSVFNKEGGQNHIILPKGTLPPPSHSNTNSPLYFLTADNKVRLNIKNFICQLHQHLTPFNNNALIHSQHYSEFGKLYCHSPSHPHPALDLTPDLDSLLYIHIPSPVDLTMPLFVLGTIFTTYRPKHHYPLRPQVNLAD